MAQDTTQSGIITKTLQWLTHPMYSDQDPIDWFAFLVLAVIAGLLWNKVLKNIADA